MSVYRKRTGRKNININSENSLDNKITVLKNYMSNSKDIKDRRFKVGGKNVNTAILFIDNLVDEFMVQDHVIKPIMTNSFEWPQDTGPDAMLEIIKDYMLYGDIVEEVCTIEKMSLGVLDGETLLLVEGSDKGLLINTQNLPKRSIQEPQTEPAVKGPNEGFVESFKDNLALIRKRLKNPNLCVEITNIGKQTNNNAALIYIKGIANDRIVNEVKNKLKSVKNYDVISCEQLMQLVCERAFSIFPLMQWTERPDKAVSSLLEGKVGVIFDNSRGMLIAPVTLTSLMQSPDDYYEKWFIGTVITVIRYISLLITIFLPAVYISITSFHPGMLPTTLLISITGARLGVPLPAFLEALIMVVTLEILQEAGIRLPKVVGQTVSIVGGLVIGQVAVQAGLISPIMVIIISLTAIASFAIPSYSLSLASRVLRVIFMILAAVLGAFGISMGVLYLLGYLCSLKSFGIGFMEPLTPYRFKDWKDSIIVLPKSLLKGRPEYLHSSSAVTKRKGCSKNGK
ncbi:spore germination protein [Acetivibrio thermocellus]|uniref:spore germination protein n=1 Tax=Acetivibrio thermocellus TaxID=1515 RepID=UPI0021ADD58F|nr:spore germination protein [Acetivibrio thermocellus]UWV46637.1 spore germination protein [Acetivibrio thermocellus]